MLKIICFKWKPRNFYRTAFEGRAVNILRNMVRRNLKIEHEFICITDDITDIDKDIKTIPIWKDIISDFGGYTKPNCFRRLRVFSNEMKSLIGKRFCWLDLDCVITGDITHLLNVDTKFKIWESTNPANFYNGSMVLMDAGARKEVWESFNKDSPNIAANKGYVGSDQAWISHLLGSKEDKFTSKDGIYSFNQIRDRQLPNNSRVIFFPGKFNPWDKDVANQHPWIKGYYR